MRIESHRFALLNGLTYLLWIVGVVALLPQAGVALATLSTEPAELPEFSHYQPILDRMPFGPLPDNFNATPEDQAMALEEAKNKAEQEAMAKKVTLSVINVTPGGATAIGFTDQSVNPPVNYYLKVGSVSDGWKVLKADFKSSTATIEKEGVEVDLALKEPRMVSPEEEVSVAAVAEQAQPADGSRRSPRNLRSRMQDATSRSPVRRGAMLRNARREASGETGRDAATAEPRQSYADRLRERVTRKTHEQQSAEAKMREHVEKLARETTAREIQRLEAEALQAAQDSGETQQWSAEQGPITDEGEGVEQQPAEQQ